jgi:hypothetical protein
MYVLLVPRGMVHVKLSKKRSKVKLPTILQYSSLRTNIFTSLSSLLPFDQANLVVKAYLPYTQQQSRLCVVHDAMASAQTSGLCFEEPTLQGVRECSHPTRME